MLRDVDYGVKITGRPIVCSCFTFTLHAQTRTSFDAGGNLDLHRLLAFDASRASAIVAWRRDDASDTATGVTRSGDGEKSLMVVDLTGAAARLAIFGRRPRRRP